MVTYLARRSWFTFCFVLLAPALPFQDGDVAVGEAPLKMQASRDICFIKHLWFFKAALGRVNQLEILNHYGKHERYYCGYKMEAYDRGKWVNLFCEIEQLCRILLI